MKEDFNSWIPEFSTFDEKRAIQIAEKLRTEPNSARNYVARILCISAKSKSLVDGQYIEHKPNRIAFYVREHKVGNLITLSGYRCFDIVKLSQYLATTRFKV